MTMISVDEFNVSEDYLQRNYPEANLAVQQGRYGTLIEYYWSEGWKNGNNPCALFNSAYYSRQVSIDFKKANLPPLKHYIENVKDNAASCHYMFSEAQYRINYKDVASAIAQNQMLSGFQHYLRHPEQRDRPHPLFNERYYREVAGNLAGLTPFKHFLVHGIAEGASPGPLFDAEWYTSAYPDVMLEIGIGRAYENPLHHFVLKGMNLGLSPMPDFDADYYTKTYPEIGDAVKNGELPSAIYHFLTFGVSEGRAPNEFFNTEYYVKNPNVARELASGEYLGPFEHFLHVGYRKGYAASSPLTERSISEIDSKSLFEKKANVAAFQALQVPKRVFAQHKSPKVSVIVPVVNFFSFTYQLLAQLHSIANDPNHPSIEVIVVDNGSTDQTRRLEDYFHGVKLVREKSPIGYTKACNLGAAAATGKYLLFTNNDIELGFGAIERAFLAAMEHGIGAVGGKILKLDGSMQEAGGILWRDGSCEGYGRLEAPTLAKFNFRREVDYCSGCFLMVPKSVFKAVGGFDEIFSPGYYEETDLAIRIRAAGYKVIFDPSIYIFHYEYASYSKGRPPSASVALMARNKRKFVQKNKSLLGSQPRYRPDSSDDAAVRFGAPVRVLLIEDLLPIPELGSGFCRAHDVVTTLESLGAQVSLLIQNRSHGLTSSSQLFIKSDISYASEFPGGNEGFIQARGGEFDLIWVCRTHNLTRLKFTLAAWKEKFPQRKIVCDTEAIAAAREHALRALASGSEDYENVDRDAIALELFGHEIVDRFVAVNGLDKKLISKVTDAPVSIVGHLMPHLGGAATFEERNGFLFCGAVHHPSSPNYDSLIWFVRQCFPDIKKRVPDARLIVIGYWGKDVEIPIELRFDGVEFVGPVDELEPYFNSARVFIAPTRYAAGIPHKVHQSMSFGLPAVVTPLLSRQLLDSAVSCDGFFDAKNMTPSAFADACVDAHSNKEAWLKVRDGGFNLLSTYCSQQSFSEGVQQAMSDD